MKKFLLMIVLLTGIAVAAQPTYTSAKPPANYMYDYWPDTTGPMFGLHRLEGRVPLSCKPFYVDEPTEIYGFVTFTYPLFEWIESINRKYKEHGESFSMEVIAADSMFDYYGLFKTVTPGQLKAKMVSDTFYIHEIDSAPTYRYVCTRSTTSSVPINVWERYFDKPITVQDSFYIGRSMLGHYRMKQGYPWYVPDTVTRSTAVTTIEDPGSTTYLNQKELIYSGFWYYTYHGGRDMLYPILTPQSEVPGVGNDTVDTGGDTVGTGGDTVGIGMHGLAQRYTAVLPNPAVGSAEVLSGMGMDRIEAYNMAGEKMGEYSPTGIKHTLDVSAWPAGTYLLRIHTPIGTATKKLVVAPR